jgi:hypothetical protein
LHAQADNAAYFFHPWHFCISCGAGNLACSRLFRRLFVLWASPRIGKEPAESRLQPGLAAPQLAQNSSSGKSMRHYAQADAIKVSYEELPMRLRKAVPGFVEYVCEEQSIEI